MIHLTSLLHSVPVAVNPMQVTHITEAPDQKGCVIHFSGGTKLLVANNYLEVVGNVTAAKHQ